MSPSSKFRIYNRLEDNFHLSNKKALLLNMCSYYNGLDDDPFKVLPITFHIQNGLNDPKYEEFVEEFNRNEKERLRASLPQTNGNSTSKKSGNLLKKDKKSI
jgi:hypothetical protein